MQKIEEIMNNIKEFLDEEVEDLYLDYDDYKTIYETLKEYKQFKEGKK